MATTVIAFVPGTTASELVGSGGTIWPTILNTDLAKQTPLAYAKMVTSFETDPLLSVGNIVSSYPLPGGDSMPCYQSLLTYLGTPASFTDQQPFTFFTYNTANKNATIPQSSRLFYMVPYDWRHNNNDQAEAGYADSATWLSNALNKLHAAYSQYDSGYQLYLVAHSMGGLVSRYVLEAQNASQNPWINRTQALITLSTPHQGAPLALSAILGQSINAKEPAAAIAFIKTTVNNSLFPSTYELLPPPQAALDFIQFNNANYGPSDAPTTLQNALSSGGFKYDTWKNRAVPFFSALKPQNTTTVVPYYCYYGSGLDTVTGFSYASSFNQTVTPAGDMVVPQTSSSFSTAAAPVQRVPFPNYTHGQMGGSDMTTAPNAIVSALKLANIPAVNP